MPERNPYIPSERAREAKQHTTIDEKESKAELSQQRAHDERMARRHEEKRDHEEEEENDEEARKEEE